MAIKKGGKFILIGLVVVGGIMAVRYVQGRPKEVGQAQTLGKVSLPDAPEASLPQNASTKLELPGTSQALNGGVQAKVLEMAWAAQTSLNLANGGDRTTKGSLLDKAGWDLSIIRQDDDAKSQQDMAKWIKQYKDGSTKEGLFIIDMGSQMDSYLKTINDLVRPLGPEYQAVIFTAVGKSYGEDQLMGDIKYKKDPQNLRGSVVRGVRLGGDLDIAIKFAADNGIPVNQNEKLYDPTALNLSYSADFMSAVVDYNSGQKETRKIVRNGKTGADTTVGFDMVATWTPGDVNAKEGARGENTVTIKSTHDYAAIMPSVILTCKKFLSDNSSKIQDLIGAVCSASDQVRSFSDVKSYALGLDSKIWNEKDQAFWTKYYNGVQTGDTHLGGSMVYNLADLKKEFGLQGGTDIFKEVYNSFKDVHFKMYGKELDGTPEYNKAVDKSFMAAVIENHPELLEGKALTTTYAATITDKEASKNVQITFATGSSTISPSSYGLLGKIYTDLVASDGMKVGIYGHTDNTGNPDANVTLSESRANAVKAWLIHKGLPEERIESKGFGDQQPMADNGTAAGKAKNRRVEIALGQ